MDDDLDVSCPNLVNDFADAVEVGVEQERLPDGLVVDRSVREANLERPEVSFADRQAASNRPEALRDSFHVVAQGEMVLEQGFQAAFERLLVHPKQVVHERFDVDLAGVRHEFVQAARRVRPPETHEMLPGEQFLDQVPEGDVHHFAERRVHDQEPVERLHEDPVVRRDRGAGLAVIRVLLDEPLGPCLVHRPRFLEMGNGLRNAALLHPAVDLLPDSADALCEAERHGEHLAVPAGDEGVRVRDRGDVDHAVLPDPFDLPGTATDDEVKALPGLDHHELLAEDPDLLLRREIHDLVAALVADRREVLEIVPASLRRHADLVPLLTQDSEVVQELRDPIRLRVFERPVGLRGPNRLEDFRPGRRPAIVQGASDDLVGQDVEGETVDVQRLEVSLLGRLDRREGLDRVVRGDGQDEATGGAVEFVARSSHPLDQGRDLAGRVVLHDLVDGPDVDPELQGRGAHETADLPRLESRLDPAAFIPREGPVMDRHIMSNHSETRAEQFRKGPCIHEDEGRSALVQGIVDRGEPGRGLGSNVEVSSGLEVLVDRSRPFETVFVLFLEVRLEHRQGFLAVEDRGNRFGMADGGGESDPPEVVFGNTTQSLQTDRQLDTTPVMRKLVNLIDDYVTHRLEMTLHEFSRNNRLEGLWSSD